MAPRERLEQEFFAAPSPTLREEEETRSPQDDGSRDLLRSLREALREDITTYWK